MDRCNLCGSTDDLMVYDGWGYGPDALDEPGTALLVCLLCQGRAYRTLLFAEYSKES